MLDGKDGQTNLFKAKKKGKNFGIAWKVVLLEWLSFLTGTKKITRVIYKEINNLSVRRKDSCFAFPIKKVRKMSKGYLLTFFPSFEENKYLRWQMTFF